MPKLHHISQRFLKEEGYRKCLANGQRIQGQETDPLQGLNNPTATYGESNNQPRGGGSLLNGMKKEESKKVNKRQNGVKRRHSDVEASAEVDMNQTTNIGSNIRGSTSSTTTASVAPAAAGVPSNLQKRHLNMIWVKIGATDHPAHLMENPDDPNNDGSTVWVKYTSNGQVQCVERSQIQTKLQDRKRHRPTYFHG